jgi:catechol-2,3-dioxygenase
MPNLLGILETALYVDEFERACAFYEQVLGLNSIYRDARLCAYDVGGRGVLLLFLRGASLETVHMPGGTIPPHDGHGPVHMALSIAADELAAWEALLKDADIEIEGPHQMAARRRKHLLPRSRRALARTRDAGPVAGILGRTHNLLRSGS